MTGDDPDSPSAKPAAVEFPPPSDAPPWMLNAWSEFKLGVREVPGTVANPRILEYFKVTSLKNSKLAQSDETPWCSAFACWAMEQSGIESPRNTMAKSWLRWGVAAPKDALGAPPYGSVVVLWRNIPQGASGHVAFFVKFQGPKVWLLGGNQANGVTFAAYPRARILSFRLPKT